VAWVNSEASEREVFYRADNGKSMEPFSDDIGVLPASPDPEPRHAEHAALQWPLASGKK